MFLRWHMVTVMLASILLSCSASANEGSQVDKKREMVFEPLALSVRIDKQVVKPGDPVQITVELSNNGKTDQVIYMPGISGSVLFEKHDKGPSRPDEFGLPLSFGRSASPNAKENFVVLQPGDFYGRRYSFTPQSPCDMHINFLYVNKNEKTSRLKVAKALVKVRSKGSEAPKHVQRPGGRGHGTHSQERGGKPRR